jgi:hypothetical protein
MAAYCAFYGDNSINESLYAYPFEWLIPTLSAMLRQVLEGFKGS